MSGALVMEQNTPDTRERRCDGRQCDFAEGVRCQSSIDAGRSEKVRRMR